MLSALAQDTRLELFRLLGAKGASGLAAGEIAARLKVPASTASFHLTAMERAGLLQATRQGRNVIYAVRHFALHELMAYLSEPLGEGYPGTVDESPTLLPAPTTTGLQPAFNVLFVCTANAARLSISVENFPGNSVQKFPVDCLPGSYGLCRLGWNGSTGVSRPKSAVSRVQSL